MTIKNWPEADRPRSKMIAQGEAALSDAELLAIFLRVGVTGVSAVDLARNLLQAFGGVAGLAAASVQQLQTIKGMGEAKAVQLKATLELARRSLAAQLAERPVLDHPEKVTDYLRLRLAQEPREVVLGLFLNAHHHLLAAEVLAEGSLNQAEVHAREVVKTALRLNAAGLILAHNHPSGNPEPSKADVQLTLHLRSALALVEVRLLDHIVVGGQGAVSLQQRGLI